MTKKLRPDTEGEMSDTQKPESSLETDKLYYVFRDFAELCFKLHFGIIGQAYGKDGIVVSDWERWLSIKLGHIAEDLQEVSHKFELPPKPFHALKRFIEREGPFEIVEKWNSRVASNRERASEEDAAFLVEARRMIKEKG